MTLEDFTRYLGAVIALIGAFVVAPAGAALWVDRAARIVQRSRTFLSRHLHFMSRPPSNLGVAAGDFAFVTSHARGRVRPGWPDQVSVELLAETTRFWLERVDSELDSLWAEIDAARSATDLQVGRARAEFDEQLRSLRTDLDAAEAAATANDSLALPVVALGVLLTAIPQELSGLHWVLYWPLMTSAVVSTVAAALGASRLHRTGRASG